MLLDRAPTILIQRIELTPHKRNNFIVKNELGTWVRAAVDIGFGLHGKDEGVEG
jgi:hypothetical protein